MKPAEALEEFVTQVRIAEVCGVPTPNVSRWFSENRIPFRHQATLCVASQGRLKLAKSDVIVAKALASLWARTVELSS